MMVEQQKLEIIASAIQQQALLFRNAGQTVQARGMEQRAAELRSLCAMRQSGDILAFNRQAA